MIKDKDGFLFDGAFGTYYASLYDGDINCELANIKYPQRVLEIHQEYIRAGAQAIKTNTFNANPAKLECSMEEIQNIIIEGYRLAKEAVKGHDCKVFADIGPCLEQKQFSMFEQLKVIVDIFLKEGATHFLFETFPNDKGLKEIAQYIKTQCEYSKIITSFAVSADGYTQQGLSGNKLIKNMVECEHVDAYGYNCVCGPMHLRRLLQTLDRSKPILIMPNAGYPTIMANRTYFRDSSTYFANEMQAIVEDGASIIGGCCGTTPVYIEKIAQLLKHHSEARSQVSSSNEPMVKMTQELNPLHEKMKKGKHIIAVEFDPPNNCDIEKFMNNAEYLREQGIDAITIADCPIARARVDSSMLAAKLRREMNMTVIPHMTCRDRNINATKALLYGLGIEGIHNVLVVTGDPVPSADRAEVKGVFSFNSQILASYIKDLNDTIFPHPFLIYGALNVNATNFAQELAKAKRKEEHGVDVFMTQPVLSKRALENIKVAKQELKGKILGGIIPVVSHRNAVYMNNEISGIDVDESYIAMYEGKTREEASELAVSLSCDMVDQLMGIVDGYYLITPFNRVEIISQIVEHIQKSDELVR
ncbi:bifunctional homocysteine S-methyltransferase/methylenetetrahydrofolate reductase [Amedibacillus sp. YH-ame10]